MNEFAQALERLLADACTPQVVRSIEAGASSAPLWSAIERSGFLDALVPQAQGGAGLSLAEVFELLVAQGRHAVPVPFGATMMARAVLATAGAQVPAGSIAIASSATQHAGGAVACRNTPHGLVADWVVAALPQRWLLLPTAAAQRSATGIHGSLHADLQWSDASLAVHAGDSPVPWREAAAVATAAQLAGGLDRVLAMTVQFANDRVQFGRSIGKFQAIQHQLAVMAEQVAAARMAAQIGCQSGGALPDPLRAALAKARTSEAAALVAPMAHAIHGAIGITAELDLQLYTRRLHEGRADHGSEQYWNRVLGTALLGCDSASLDFMRAALLPS